MIHYIPSRQGFQYKCHFKQVSYVLLMLERHLTAMMVPNDSCHIMSLKPRCLLQGQERRLPAPGAFPPFSFPELIYKMKLWGVTPHISFSLCVHSCFFLLTKSRWKKSTNGGRGEKDIREEKIWWIKIHTGNLFLFLSVFEWSKYQLKWYIL